MSVLNNPEAFLGKIKSAMKSTSKILNPKGAYERAVCEEIMLGKNKISEIENINASLRGRAEEISRGVNINDTKFKGTPDDLETIASMAKENFSAIDELEAANKNIRDKGVFASDIGVGRRGNIMFNTAKNYYNPNSSNFGARVGVTAGAYMAGAIGLRYADGGTLTRNSNGESDIAGIPGI